MTPASALARLRTVEAEDGAPSLARRRALLAALRRSVIARADAVAEAAHADFGQRDRTDTLLADVLLVAEAAAYSRRWLRDWARPKPAPVPLPFLPARAWTECVPKGVVGIMAPWNYPLQLALLPAIDAIAAGNRVVLKPSESAPRVAALIAEIAAEAWGPRIAAVVQGASEVAADFAAQPWDHLVFTGGTETGRKVMRAAAEHLTPLTLELGGKCPALVLPGADLARAARDILAAKAVNAGQTCIAPDTVLLVGHGAAEFARAARASGIAGTGTAVINTAQQERLDRLGAGSAITWLGAEPGAIGLAPSKGGLAEEEIFGPILAVEECAGLDAALAWIRARPHPLAIYAFGATGAEEAAIAAGTKSGALLTGRALDYAAFPGLPFGGVGASGFGRRNGEAGFREFSHSRARVRHGGWSLSRLLDRPRAAMAQRLARRLVR
ncbi:aldehyde dehydrogenase family protein [Roseococcus sp. SYP-B2431]|uniref:aldehyde dehydrogenase family protein n=1 Tax=Roseococcus sp. SYP-B2431 TaxID=2496640 RepID=UPI00103CAA15|nr:aldehyde dehydrogenase family protein [Roseococcus sp. SYP-B2431]TCH98877.1 aldehyde dehydrogenase family protein [Roseococcus sp. SYP-B2431]